MKREKVKLNKKVTQEKIIKRKRNNKKNNAGENLDEREFRKDSGLKKKIVIKEDGRYLIYYDFNK
jgi:hypothetical protein